MTEASFGLAGGRLPTGFGSDPVFNAASGGCVGRLHNDLQDVRLTYIEPGSRHLAANSSEAMDGRVILKPPKKLIQYTVTFRTVVGHARKYLCFQILPRRDRKSRVEETIQGSQMLQTGNMIRSGLVTSDEAEYCCQ